MADLEKKNVYLWKNDASKLTEKITQSYMINDNYKHNW